jgi:hypothetical protein
MSVKRLAIVAIVVAIATACGTIIHGTRQDVGVSSSPTGAQVFVDNTPLGQTPVVAKLTRKDNHVIRITMPGYQTFETNVTRSVSGWVWGNIVFGGLIGLAVDAISGGLYKLRPEQVTGTLATAEVRSGQGTIYVAVVLAPDPSWEKVGQLTPISP